MIAIIDITGNNLTSIGQALRRLGLEYRFTHDTREIKESTQVILPGVGRADQAMFALRSHGLVDVLKGLSQPILGICLGLQLLMEHSEEGDVECLGLLSGRVRALKPDLNEPLPHMGWNTVTWKAPLRLQEGLNQSTRFYFVHSYAVFESEDTLATCDYAGGFSAIVGRGKILGIQAHPEKSAQAGLVLLKNALAL